MKKTLFALLTISILLLVSIAVAQIIPMMINYQGYISNNSSSVLINGDNYFKFAIVNTSGDTTFWSNDSTSSGGSEPTDSVTISVTDGVYSVQLGDTSITNMNSLPTTPFETQNIHLRVWFSEDGVAFEQFAPDTQLVSAGFAHKAETVSDGSVTSAAIQDNTITNADINVSANISSSKIDTSGLDADSVDGMHANDLQERTSLACSVGSALRVINPDGSGLCAGWLQTRVNGTCPAGSSIRVINSDGTVDCELDSNYSAGTGLNLIGSTFNLDVPLSLVGSTLGGSILSGLNTGNHSFSAGVDGYSLYGIGVYGLSNNIGTGVRGESSTGVAGYFTSTSGYGLIVENGNVGIGTTTPLSKLDISAVGNGSEVLRLSTEMPWTFRQLGTGASTALELASVDGVGDKDFVINTSGNVGIGTTNPSTTLEVAGKIKSQNSRSQVKSDTYISTTSNSWVDMPGMSVSISTGNSDVLISLIIGGLRYSGTSLGLFRILLDGLKIWEAEAVSPDVPNQIAAFQYESVTLGTHTIKVQWRHGGVGGTVFAGANVSTRTLTAIELF